MSRQRGRSPVVILMWLVLSLAAVSEVQAGFVEVAPENRALAMVRAAEVELRDRSERLRRMAMDIDWHRRRAADAAGVAALWRLAAGRLMWDKVRLVRELETLEATRDNDLRRVEVLDEALKAAGIALVQQDREALWQGGEDKRAHGLRSWITSLSAERSHQAERLARLDGLIEHTRERVARIDAASERAGVELAAANDRVRADHAVVDRLSARRGEAQRRLAAAEEFSRMARAELDSRMRHVAPALNDVPTVIAATSPRAAERKPLGAPSAVGQSAGDPLLIDPLAPELSVARGLDRDVGFRLARLPVEGAIVRGYVANAEDLLGRGLTIAGAPGRPVVAPSAGRVAFSGSFKRYGRLLIIDHGGEYHTLIAGLAELHAREGEIVEAGQIVGRLAKGGNTNPRLYLELRLRGRPINPLPWLAASADKVRG